MGLTECSGRLPLVSELRNPICRPETSLPRCQRWRSGCRRRKSIFLLTKYQLRTEMYDGIWMNLRLDLRSLHTNPVSLGIAILGLALLPAFAQTGSEHKAPPAPWMNSRLSPDDRAALVVKEMTLDEKISLLHGTGMASLGPVSPLAVKSNGGAGYVVGIPRLGIPAIQMSDAAYGVRSTGEDGRYSTALPDDLAGAASWAT